MIYGTSNDVLISDVTAKDTKAAFIAVHNTESGGSLETRLEGAGSNGRESVVSDPGYVSSSSSDRPRFLSVEEFSTTEYNAVISPCNTSICDVLNDTFIASTASSPEGITEDKPTGTFEQSLCDRARSIVTSLQDAKNANKAQEISNYDQKLDFDMFFDGVLESRYSELSAQNFSSIFANDAGSRAPTDGEYEMSINDLNLMDEIALNLHGTNVCQQQNVCQQTLPSLMEFSKSGDSQSRQNADFSGQDDEFLKRHLETQVFAKVSSTKSGVVPQSTSAADKIIVPTTSEEEAWRSYLENPITAATTAMMSIRGDEDSAAALGMLYDYYKVPKEKRLLSYPGSSHAATLSPAPPTPLSPKATIAVPEPEQPVTVPKEKRLLSYPGSSAELKMRLLQQSIPTSTFTSSFVSDVRRSGEISTNVLPPITVTNPKTSLPFVVDSEQRLDPVGDIIKQQGSNTVEDPKVKSELSRVDENQKLATKVEKLPSLVFTGNATFDPAATIDFSALSGHSNDSYVTHKEQRQSSEMQYVMEAPKSLKQKEDDPTMSYINKGQFYSINLTTPVENREIDSGTKIRSVIHIVFGDRKSEEEQLRHWKYWHARQHTVKQRIIDIADYKESNMIYDVEEIAHNAISFCWNACDTARIFVSCNCLSTDFSAQKGIKGLPLLLQIDSYIVGQDTPFHRGHCQIKVFCDKGAERKIRDEERKASRKRQKTSKTSKTQSQTSNLLPISELKPTITPQTSSSTQAGNQLQRRLDFVRFKTMPDLETKPVLFVPGHSGHTAISHAAVTATLSPAPPTPLSPKATIAVPEQPATEIVDRPTSKRPHADDEEEIAVKVPRTKEERVLLYVRHQADEVYDGLMLESPDLPGLKRAISLKYGCASSNIRNVFKKSKKGILVRMDNNIIRHYSNEDTFVIDIRNEIAAGDVILHHVTFTEV